TWDAVSFFGLQHEDLCSDPSNAGELRGCHRTESVHSSRDLAVGHSPAQDREPATLHNVELKLQTDAGFAGKMALAHCRRSFFGRDPCNHHTANLFGHGKLHESLRPLRTGKGLVAASVENCIQ